MPARPHLAPFVVAVAIGSTAYIAAFTAAALAAREITGSAQLSGLPSAFGTLGTAAGIALLSGLMGRSGRRAGLLAGYVAGVAGAGASVLAVAGGSFPVLLAGSIAIGFGNAALQLSRYAASDLVPPDRRAAAVGVVVWGSTVGAVLGPNLLEPAGALAGVVGRPPLEGGIAVALAGFVLTLLVTFLFIRATPASAHTEADATRTDDTPGSDAALLASRRALLANPRVRVAMVAMISGQIVMVLVMTMTPVHVHDMGESLSTVGFVISAHMLGMFALSPLTGRLVARFGTIPVIYAGFGALLLAAVLAAVARVTEIPVLALGLFLLGYGWNLAFVAGSSLLAAGAGLAERIRLQGTVDVLVWLTSGAASVSSGILLDRAGYAVLALVAGALLALPAIAIAVQRRALPAEPVLEPVPVEAAEIAG